MNKSDTLNKRQSERLQQQLQVDRIVTTIDQLVRRDLREPATGLTKEARLFYRKCQNQNTLKKYKMMDGSLDTQELSFEKFFAINEHIGRFQDFKYPEQKTLAHVSLNKLDRTLLRARSLAHEILHEFDMEKLFAYCKHSGGVSQNIKFEDTSIEAKFSYPISTTRLASIYMDSYFSFDTQCHDSVIHHNRQLLNVDKYQFCKSSRATTVPKTNKIDRMIAIEPTANMFLQQGAMHYMYALMKSFGLDVSRLPDRHKFLARKGSLDGSLATIDFSSASDCLSIKLVEFLLPPKWLHILKCFRCESMTLRPNDPAIRLNMFSTMGNATTFPLETIIFYCLAVASCHTFYQPRSASLLAPLQAKRACSVFGDDCILPTQVAVDFCKVAESVGFIVNSEKSFMDPLNGFRESCGGDYLRGEDVRPFNLKRPTACSDSVMEAWLYSVCNKILTKYRLYFGSLTYLYDRHVFRYIIKVIKRYREKPFLVPDDYPSDSGLQLSSDSHRFSLSYLFQFNKITKDEHGTLYFNYCRFQYRTRRKHDEYLRYTDHLRSTCVSEFLPCDTDSLYYTRNDSSIIFDPGDERVPFSPIRRIGGYVVARNRSAHWASGF